MALSEFSLNDKPNPQAMLEMSFLLLCLGKNQRQRVEDWLAKNDRGGLVVWNFRPKAWPSSYAVIRREDTIWVIVYGTSNLKHVYYELTQSPGVKVQSDPKCYEHGFFKDVGEGIYNDLRVLYPSLATMQVRISGHSLGSAAATIASVRLSEWMGSDRVQVMNFAEPRSISVGDKRVHSSIHFRLYEPDDVVNDLPPENLDAFYKELGRGQWQKGSLIHYHQWKHYGRQFAFVGFNLLVETKEDPANSFSSFQWTETVETLHYIKHYAEKTIEYYKGAGQLPRDVETIKLIRQTELDPRAQDENTVVPINDWIRQQDYQIPFEFAFGKLFDPIEINKVEFSRMRSVGVKLRTRDNILELGGVSLTTPNNYVCTSYINNGTYGMSHKFALKPNLSEAQAKAKSLALIEARSWLLGNNMADALPVTPKSLACPVHEYYRLSFAISPDEGVLEPVDSVTGGGARGYVGNGADNFANALTCRVRIAATAGRRASHGTWTHVGFPDAVIKDGRFTPNVTITPAKNFGKYLSEYFALLTNGDYGAMVPDPATPVKLSSKIEVETATGLIKITSPAHGFLQGAKIKITGGTVKGLRKTWYVNVTDSNVITLQNSANLADDLPSQVKMRQIADPNGVRSLIFAAYDKVADLVKVSGHSRHPQFLAVSFPKRGRR